CALPIWPGRRRSSSAWISSTVRGRFGGQPSMTTPTAGPWLSPQVVMVKSFPKLFGIAGPERWVQPPARQATNPPRRATFSGSYRHSTRPFTCRGLSPFISAPGSGPTTLFPFFCMSLRFFRLSLAACLASTAWGAPAPMPVPNSAPTGGPVPTLTPPSGAPTAIPTPLLTPDAVIANDSELVGPIKLPDADIDSVLNLLEILTGRTILRPQALPAATYHLVIDKKIPKPEAILALETLLSLNGVGVAPLGEKFLKVVALPQVKNERSVS